MPEVEQYQAVPGSVVPVGAQIAPAGQSGPAGAAGSNAFTLTSASFTVPAYGSTVVVNMNSAIWMVVGEMLWVDQAGGGVGQPAVLQVTAINGNAVTLLNPTVANIPLASSTQPGLLGQVSGNTTDFVDGTNHPQNLVTAINPTIWNMRLRSFNAIGNPNFEVDQRNCNARLTNPANQIFVSDRWMLQKTVGTVDVWSQNMSPPPPSQVIPGTSFGITKTSLTAIVTANTNTLASTDFFVLSQVVEGPAWRELSMDVHSMTLLVFCSVALKFSLYIRDPANTHSLVKLCSVPASTWTIISLPNLPIWPSAGNFSTTPGGAGYNLGISLACGTGNIAPAADTWQNGNYLGASGMDNFLAQPVNSGFYCAFVQHEPGALCTQLIDKPFSQNLTECQRYYQKAVGYATKPLQGGVIPVGTAMSSQAFQRTNVRFAPTMAKAPTLSSTGATTTLNQVYLDGTGNLGTTGAYATTDTGWYSFTFSATPGSVVGLYLLSDWTADTGW